MYGYEPRIMDITSTSSSDLWSIVSIFVAICAGIILYFTFLNPENAKNYKGTTEKIYNFLSFKTMSLEAILKITYLIVAFYITIMSFSYISTSFILFLLILFLGNLITRLIFECALLFIQIYKKINEINDKLDKKKTKNNE